MVEQPAGDQVVLVQEVGKIFGEHIALDGANLEVRRGQLYGVFGPNGAGKSTLMKIMTGQLKPTSGTVFVLGIPPQTQPLKVKAMVGIVPESESPPSYLTGEEYLEFVGRIRGVEDLDNKINEWMDFFDLTRRAGTLCKDMSKGMRQKIMLAAAFIHEPELLFLDEPFINLDPIYQRKVRDYVKDYVSRGGTALLSSHLLDLAEKTCSHAALINEGKIIGAGPLQEMLGKDMDLEDLFLEKVGYNK